MNGLWAFSSIDGESTITVPFAWETPASGIARTWLERGTYRRRLHVPPEWGPRRMVLCFGAVHHRTQVFLDGEHVGEHIGGYDSFEFDVTDWLTPGEEAELTVEVEAPADKRAIVHGKQRSIPRDDYDGVCFTPTSGIWQSVWLEARGRTYADQVVLRGDSRLHLDLDVRLSGDAVAGVAVHVRVLGSGEHADLVADASGHTRGRITLESPRPWSPADPHLYRVEVITGEAEIADRVVCTTGLRSIEVRGEQVYLNDERIYLRGVLDQGYWPETGMTAPDQAALLADLELARGLGYTLVRKHLKLEDPRWLHEADRMGMLVWAEPACPSRFSPEAVAAFEAQIEPMVARDGNHPSIVLWGLYNEEWGLDWDIPGSPERASAAVNAYDLLARLDRSRPIVENSGWSHVKSDLVDWHYYEPDPQTWADTLAGIADGTQEEFPVRLGPSFVVDKSLYGAASFPRSGVPILNSEYGEGFTSLERAWHLRWQTQELRRHDRFVGYVYTELADVEHENAGLLDDGRRAKDWGGLTPADVNADTVLVLDLVPAHAGADIAVPTAEFTVDVRVSHLGPNPVSGTVQAAWVAAGRPSREGGAHEISTRSQVVPQQIAAEPFRLSEPVALVVPPPGAPARLLIWLSSMAGEVLARTFIDAADVEPPNRRGART